MKQEIVARVHFESTGLQIIVRKAIFKDDGNLDKKYGLSKDGDWIEVPVATMYPDECYLPIVILDKSDSEAVERIVENLRNEEALRTMSDELDDREGVYMAAEIKRSK